MILDDDGDCPYEYPAYTCDTGDGGRYCKTNDDGFGTSNSESYFLEPGSNSNTVLLISVFWEYLMTPNTGNVRLEVHHEEQIINTISANWDEQFIFP